MGQGPFMPVSFLEITTCHEHPITGEVWKFLPIRIALFLAAGGAFRAPRVDLQGDVKPVDVTQQEEGSYKRP
jgi:hypothetical protein